MASDGRPPAYNGAGRIDDDRPPSYVSAITSPLADAVPHSSAPPPAFSLSSSPRQPASSLPAPPSGFNIAEGAVPPDAAAAPPPRYSVAAGTASTTASSLPKAYSPPIVSNGRPSARPSSPSLASLPLPEAYKPPVVSARKKTPLLSALPLPQAYVQPLSQSTGHGRNIDTSKEPPPSPPPPKYPGTNNTVLLNGRQRADPGGNRGFPGPTRQDPSLSSNDGPPPEYSRSLSMPPAYSLTASANSMLAQPHHDPASNRVDTTLPVSESISLASTAVATGIRNGASELGVTNHYPVRQRKRSCSNPPPVLQQATVPSLLHFISKIGSTGRHNGESAESCQDLPSPPPYKEDSHRSLNNRDGGTTTDEMPPAYDESIVEPVAISNASPEGVSLRQPLDLPSPPAYTSNAASLRINEHQATKNLAQTTDASASPPAYSKEEGILHEDIARQSTKAVAATLVAPPLTFGILGALPPPQYSPPTPKPGLIFPPVFGADGKSKTEASAHMALLRSATAAVHKFYLEGRRSHADRTRTLVDQFQNCRLGDFDLQTCRVIGRGSNGLVLCAAIRTNSPHFDPSLWGRQYALKRRFLYTSPETFRAEFTTPFRHQHNNMLSIYGSFTGRVVEPNPIEQAHLSGEQPLFLEAGEVPSQKQAVDSELTSSTAVSRAQSLSLRTTAGAADGLGAVPNNASVLSSFLLHGNGLEAAADEVVATPIRGDVPRRTMRSRSFDSNEARAMAIRTTNRSESRGRSVSAGGGLDICRATSGASSDASHKVRTEFIDLTKSPDRWSGSNTESTIPANHVEYVVMDLSTQGDLSDLVVERAKSPGQRLTEGEALRVLFQVSLALAHLYGLGIVHRDLKCENILLFAGRCALSDFGASLPASASFRSADHNGNPNAVPPEVAHALAAEGRTEANYSGADTWALGVMVYEMLNLPSPIPNGGDSRSFHGPPPRLPPGYERCQIVVDALLVDIRDRPEPDEVVSMLGRLIWIPGSPANDNPGSPKSAGEEWRRAAEDAAIAFEALCSDVIRRLESDGFVFCPLSRPMYFKNAVVNESAHTR
eukprot:INCI5876.2.p1 GENE.INCI5876.2~~INCI5876.2.p1  ORF type:complete len:1058 (+),score=117.60 INCI5876.2:198-3371(+)